MFDVIVLGSANLDLVVTTPRLPGPGETITGGTYAEYPGGKGLNQAVAAARSGARVAMVGAVGDDDAGRTLRAVAAEAGIDLSGFATVAGTPTGRALITVDDTAENTIVIVAGANATVATTEPPDGRVIIAQLEIPTATIIEAFRVARDKGVRTILNPAPAATIPDDLLQLCDIVVPNEHEVELIGGADALLAGGVPTVVVTRGAAGVTTHTRDAAGRSVVVDQPPLTVTPVDTTGAGDAFCGALAARLAAGDELTAAVRWASAAGALATTRVGAVPSLPRATEIERLLTG